MAVTEEEIYETLYYGVFASDSSCGAAPAVPQLRRRRGALSYVAQVGGPHRGLRRGRAAAR